MAGRRPKPTALKRLEGNPGHRKLNDDEPEPGGVAICPSHLSDDAKVEWKRVSKELRAAGMLTSVDRAALAAYCMSWANWKKALEHLEAEGMVTKAPSGYPVQNPYVGIANTSLDQMRKFLIEFGMTPASRSRIKVDTGGDETDPLDDFLGGTNGKATTRGRAPN